MNLSTPYEGLLSPSLAQVILALHRSKSPVTGRGLASQLPLSTGQVNQMLIRLVTLGIVGYTEQPPAKLYKLNEQSLLAKHLVGIVTAEADVVSWLTERLGEDGLNCKLAVIFGSFSRRSAGVSSDLDLYVAWEDEDYEAIEYLELQVMNLAAEFYYRYGNALNPIILKMSEVESSFASPGGLEINLANEGTAVLGAGLFAKLKEPLRWSTNQSST